MFSRVTAFGISGIRAYRITVETDLSKGIPNYEVVGLGNEAVKESRKRIRAAVVNRGFPFPMGHIVQNLAPGDVRKTGPSFDLAMCVGLLSAAEILSSRLLELVGIIGALSLDGKVSGVKGVIPVLAEGKEEGLDHFLIPFGNLEEAGLLPGIYVYPVKDLTEVAEALSLSREEFEAECKARSAGKAAPEDGSVPNDDDLCGIPDFSSVCGQEGAKRALEIAAAGRHNVLMIGSPGCGKTLLAGSFRGILPDLSEEEYFEVQKIYSSCGLSREIRSGRKRPFRTVHHGITRTALLGGGRPVEIGEISLAHRGVLFLDELSETPRSVIEALREPLEEKLVHISNCGTREIIPSDFLFLAAANPCPCGNLYENNGLCTCTDGAISAYNSHLSYAILDRIDIQIPMKSVDSDKIGGNKGESSAEIRKRVERAVNIQKERYRGESINFNGDLSNAVYRKDCELDRESRTLLKRASSQFGLSVRGYEKVIKVARTIADLEAREKISEEDILESLRYRCIDRLTGKI